MGGAFFLQHSAGEMIFINNTFSNNVVGSLIDSLISNKEAAGGAIYCYGYSTSKINLQSNFFFGNIANRGNIIEDLFIVNLF